MEHTLLERCKQPFRWARSWFWVLWNGYPARNLRVIGVTGTDGKTTTCWLIYSMLQQAGLNVGMITTVGIKYVVSGKEVRLENSLHVTNPDAKVVHRLLRTMMNAGVDYVILEVTSHRLAQMKTVGYNVSIGVLTNLTPEHLDYHGTMERYAAAKARLFRAVKFAVLNRDSDWFEYFRTACPSFTKILPYSKTSLRKIPECLEGEYNKYNIAAAETVAEIVGVPIEARTKAVAEFAGVPGRREEVKNSLGIRMVVDFAHTANGLQQLLQSLKKPHGKVLLVFGCTGERDKSKRPEMGKVAAQYADVVVVTADDPRSEDLGDIYAAIVSQVPHPEKTFIREDDRDAAIALAMSKAKRGDTVVAAGMGHEQTILIKGSEIKRSDRQAFEKALHRRME